MTRRSLEKNKWQDSNSVVVVRMERIHGLAVTFFLLQVNSQLFDSILFTSNPAERSDFACYFQKEICIWGKGTESDVRLALAAA